MQGGVCLYQALSLMDSCGDPFGEAAPPYTRTHPITAMTSTSTFPAAWTTFVFTQLSRHLLNVVLLLKRTSTLMLDPRQS
jgi:hypothetical protein